MKTLYCDVCKKSIDKPISEWTYYHVREYDICDPCKEKIDASLRPRVRAQFPYTAQWYEDQLMAEIKKAVGTPKKAVGAPKKAASAPKKAAGAKRKAKKK